MFILDECYLLNYTFMGNKNKVVKSKERKGKDAKE